MPMSTPVGFASAGGTVSSTSLALTDAPFSFTQEQLDQADQIRITCSTQAIAYRYDGTDAVAVSHVIPVGGETVIRGNQNINQLRVIRAGGSDGALYVTLEKF
ncbi:MAG: hypothetical protein K8I30_20355 [Anaerolineae bacterium]|nr:hypothetical protein [Anaerolineae bacterium]